MKGWIKKKINWYREATKKPICYEWKKFLRSVNDKLMLYAGLGFEFMLSIKNLIKILSWASNTLARGKTKGLWRDKSLL